VAPPPPPQQAPQQQVPQQQVPQQQPAQGAPVAAPEEPAAAGEPDLVQPDEETTGEEAAPPEPQSIAAAETAAAIAAVIAQEEGITFRLTSDWGSAYTGQEVTFTFLIRNERPEADGGENDLNDLVLYSRLPANLEVQGATADRGSDPKIDGNEVQYTLGRLRPGQVVEITIPTTIRRGVPPGTILVVQGRLDADDVERAINSNIVTVLIVDTTQQITTTLQTAVPPTATGATAYPAPGLQVVGSPSPSATDTSVPPTATIQQAGVAIEPTATTETPEETAPIPATSAGVPIGGIALLGFTLFVRTWRLKRERERV
jgi:hypothetical protein